MHGLVCTVAVRINMQYVERSGSVLDLITRGRWFDPHWRQCVVSFGKTPCPLFSIGVPTWLIQCLLGRKASAQTKVAYQTDLHRCCSHITVTRFLKVLSK